MADPQHVFISYARNDGHEYAARLDTDLTASGFRIWRDTRDIDPNQDFSAELERAIAESSHVVCCITPDTRRDDSFVRREIGYALAIKKPVVPLIFENTLPPIHIINVTRIQAIIEQWDQMIAELDARLRRANDRTYEQVTLPDDPYREYLTALYDQIVGYLNLTVFSLITLRGEASPDAVEKKTANVLPMAFFDMAGIDVRKDNDRSQFNNFQEAFDKYDGHVLLLGEPGAGKTTTLFAFARDAVAARLNNPMLPLPILTPIVTWDAQSQISLADWLSRQIPALKNGNLTNLLDSGGALLLLDGLDELGAEREDEKTKANYDPRLRFMRLIPYRNEMIITCRIKDYANIGTKLSLRGAVTLQPLNDVQMRTYLHDLPDLWAAIETDSDLREVAQTPLLLSLFTFAFRDLPQEAQKLRDLKGGDVRDKIFETYVCRRYEHEERKPYAILPFRLQQIKEILGQVAMQTLGYWYPNNFIFGEDFETILGYEKAIGFCKLAIHLHFLLHITINDDESEEVFKGYQFIHLLLRDYFAFEYALSNLNDKTRYTQFSQVITTPVQALGTLRDSRAVEPLIELLHSSDQFMSDQVVNALTNIGEKSIVPLLGVLKHSNDRVRRYAIEALGKIGDQRVVEQLVDLLKDRSIYIRVSAVTALGNLKDLRAVEPLCFLLEDEHDLVRISAVIALNKLNDLRAVDPLIAALDDDNPSMRYRAALGLGLLRSEKAVKPLISHLTDMGIASIFFQDRVQDGVAEALKRIGTPESLAAVEGWRKSQHKGEN